MNSIDGGPPGATSEADARILCETIRALVRRFSISERADVSCCGMTVAQAATLEALEIGGPLRLGDLGRRMGIQPSTLTRNLHRLEERGLVERTSESGDGRATRARLTARGRDAAREVQRQSVRFACSVLDRLPAERRADVLRSVRELLDAVHDATQTCCPGAYDHLFQSGPMPAAMERKDR